MKPLPACGRFCCGAAPRFLRNRGFRSLASYRPCYHRTPVESPLGILKEYFGDVDGRIQQSGPPRPGRPAIDHRACPGRSSGSRGLAGGGGCQPGYGSFGGRATRGGRDPGTQRDRSMGITVYFGRRKGSASTADFSLDAVRATVAKACSIARFTAEDACSGLADAVLMAREPSNLDLSHPWNIAADRAIEIAKSCEASALAFDPRINNSEGASLSTHQGLHVYGNTHGFVGGYPTTSHSLSCVVLAGTGEDMQRDYWYSSSRDWHELEQAEAIGRESARRTIARLGPRRLSTRRAPVLFVPEIARGLIGHFTAAIRGSSQYRQSSFLLNSVGQQVFPSGFSIAERPHIPKAAGSALFDDEGVATRDRELVADGVLTGYILSSYSARKLGLETTGNAGGPHNLLVKPSLE